MRAFSTIEVLIAFMLLSTTFVAATLLIFGAPQVLQSAREHYEARMLAESLLMREERRIPDEFPAIASYETMSDGYDVRLDALLLPDETTKRLTAHVSWQGVGGAMRALSLTTYVTDYLHPGEYPCDILPRGRWQSLQARFWSLSAGDLLPTDFSSSVPVTSSIAATRTRLALAAAATETMGAPSLFLFALEDGEPRYHSSLATSSTTAAIADMVLTSTRAYLASASACAMVDRCGQLKVIDLAGPGAPRILSQLLLARTSPPYAGSATEPVAARSIWYGNGYVYLGLEQAPTALGQEFNIIDVRDPLRPVWVGGFRVGRTVNDIVVRDDRAYLATNARATADVLVLDVSDPTHIREIARAALPPLQPTSRFGFAHVLGLYGDELHVGRSYISNADEWVLLGVQDLGLLQRMSRNLGTALSPASVRALILRESQALVLLPHALEAWDRGDASDPIRMGSFPIADEATGAVCVGNAIYVAATDGTRGRLIRVTPS